MKKIFQTNGSFAATALRIMLGLVLFPHGAQKMLGWFGGYGFTGTMNFFTETVHLPWIIGFLVIVIEFAGSLMLIAGIATRFVALAVIADMIGIIVSSHLEHGFFINWFGNQKGEGYEYHLLAIGMALSLLIAGAGKLSLDLIIAGKKK